MSHVHGLGTDPEDGTLFAATHTGVIRVDRDGSLTRVADRYQDTMAFTVVGPGHFLASGHPDLSEKLPIHLGLIESVDAARSWSILSLGGEADFHALDVSGARIYGFDATSGQLLTSTDRKNWETVAREPIVDLAADPTDPDRVVATAPDGTLSVHDLTGPSRTVMTTAPQVVLVEWPTAELFVGVAAEGAVHLSRDAGRSWARVTDAPGAPQALSVSEEAWHVATDRGIYRSVDEGGSWEPVVGARH